MLCLEIFDERTECAFIFRQPDNLIDEELQIKVFVRVCLQERAGEQMAGVDGDDQYNTRASTQQWKAYLFRDLGRDSRLRRQKLCASVWSSLCLFFYSCRKVVDCA